MNAIIRYDTIIIYFINNVILLGYWQMGGAVALWLVRWTPDRAVRVRALAGALRCFLRQDTLLPPRCIYGYPVYMGTLRWTNYQRTGLWNWFVLAFFGRGAKGAKKRYSHIAYLTVLRSNQAKLRRTRVDWGGNQNYYIIYGGSSR